MYKLILSLLVVGLAGCSSKYYIGNASDTYKGLSCAIEQKTCRINYGDDSHISYSVEKTGINTYKVEGNVDLYMDVVGGMHPKVSFYVIFMDDSIVQFERRVKTGSRKATFEFEVETIEPIQKTTIQKMTYHTRS